MTEPLQDVLILEMVEAKGESVILPESYSAEKDEGTLFKVVASGPGAYGTGGEFVANTLKPGDYIITAAYGVSKFKVRGKKLILARERDVVLKLSKEEVEG